MAQLKDLTVNGDARVVGKIYGKSTESEKTVGTITIQKNGTNVQTFNGSENKTANITVPTVYTGTSTPSASTGQNGDIYIQTS